MKIKVTKSSDSAYWYTHHQGEEFEVVRENALEYWTREPSGYLNFILKKDSKVLKEVKEKINLNNDITIGQLQSQIHQANLDAGWWTDLDTGMDLAEEARKRTRFGKALVAEKLALVHSEVSEGLEGTRKNLMDDKLPHRTMLEVELADSIIRTLDIGGALNLDIAGAIVEKLTFNRSRPDHKIENRKLENGKAY